MDINMKNMIYRLGISIIGVISVILGIAFLHDLKGFGIATILSAIFVGKTLTVMKNHIPLES